MWLLKDELVHFSLALLVGLYYFRKSKDWRVIPVALMVGFLIDIDHLVDYFLHFGWRFSLKDFLDVTTYMGESLKIYVPLHAWEWIALLWLVGRWSEKKLMIKNLPCVLVLAFIAHLAWDQYSVLPGPFAYFISYRFYHHFSFLDF